VRRPTPRRAAPPGSGRLRRFRHQPLHRLGHVHRRGEAQPHRRELGGRRLVDRRDHLADALEVRRVVGDHQHVRRRERVDDVVRRHQWPQDRDHLRRRFVLEVEHLGDDLVAARARVAREP
jgi:hypothetical protein